MSVAANVMSTEIVRVPHVIKGEVVTGAAQVFGPANAQFATPALDLDRLVWPRSEAGPAFDVRSPRSWTSSLPPASA